LGWVSRKNYRYSLPEGDSWTFNVTAPPSARVSPENVSNKVREYGDGKLGVYGDSLVSPEHAKKLAEEAIQAHLRKKTEYQKRLDTLYD
jgi:hypothetical protein